MIITQLDHDAKFSRTRLKRYPCFNWKKINYQYITKDIVLFITITEIPLELKKLRIKISVLHDFSLKREIRTCGNWRGEGIGKEASARQAALILLKDYPFNRTPLSHILAECEEVSPLRALLFLHCFVLKLSKFAGSNNIIYVLHICGNPKI